MTKAYRQVPIEVSVHERLLAARARASEFTLYKEQAIGLSSMLGVLLAHFEQTPPDLEWLKAQVLESPRKGRPRRSEPVTRINEWGSKVTVPPPPSAKLVPPRRQHKWVAPKADPAHRICLLCGQVEAYEIVDACDWIGVSGRMRDGLTARGARSAGFTDEEIRELGIALP